MGGLCLNEDNSHFFATRAGQALTPELVDAWVDQYAGTQVRELFLCPNSQRTSYDSAVWDPVWKGYDPKGPDDQPLFASISPSERTRARHWVDTALKLKEAGIDVYQRWTTRARAKGISPWISLRMNDMHFGENPAAYTHSSFWRDHPILRRVAYRYVEPEDRALDYAQPEVRAHALALIREVTERWNLDGLELDWMRFPKQLRPGHEESDAPLITSLVADARKATEDAAKRLGHPVKLGVRVASRPETALGLGLDAVTWARRKLVDWVVVTPFFQTIEPDMPIELWRGLLGGDVTLCAGLELHVSSDPHDPRMQTNSLETVRGAAAALLDRGVDRVYLFNYMDSETTLDDPKEYAPLLREAGSLTTSTAHRRRHVVTYSDTWAPGEPRAYPLPASAPKGQWLAIRVPLGPKPVGGTARLFLAVQGGTDAQMRTWTVRVNGGPCTYAGTVVLPKPNPRDPTFAFSVPVEELLRGYNLIELAPASTDAVTWVEVDVTP